MLTQIVEVNSVKPSKNTFSFLAYTCGSGINGLGSMDIGKINSVFPIFLTVTVNTEHVCDWMSRHFPTYQASSQLWNGYFLGVL